MSTPNLSRILVVEDSDGKFDKVLAVLKDAFPHAEIVRAATVAEAEVLIGREEWPLVLLDISMNIRTSQSRVTGSGGHANLGGLVIAQKMFLKRREFPTIILTAFDSFQAEGPRRDRAEVVGLEDIERKAREYLGDCFLGYVRYGAQNWDGALREIFGRIPKK